MQIIIICNNIIENNLIEKDDKILIAFSGGPDSVFLYYILKYLGLIINFT